MCIKLTGREKKVLELVRDGHTNKEIGERLKHLSDEKKKGVGPDRVKDLLDLVANKLLLDGDKRRSRVQLVKKAIRNGHIPCYCKLSFSDEEQLRRLNSDL